MLLLLYAKNLKNPGCQFFIKLSFWPHFDPIWPENLETRLSPKKIISINFKNLLLWLNVKNQKNLMSWFFIKLGNNPQISQKSRNNLWWGVITSGQNKQFGKATTKTLKAYVHLYIKNGNTAYLPGNPWL